MGATNSLSAVDLSNVDVLSIYQARETSNAAIAKKDVKTISSFWADNFVQIAGDGSHARGKKKIVEDWQYMFAHGSPVFERLPDEILISASGDNAWEKGRWSYKTDPFFGNYSAMWRKVNGKWMTQCELYVTL